jgi:small subunit ribosomal protein S21
MSRQDVFRGEYATYRSSRPANPARLPEHALALTPAHAKKSGKQLQVLVRDNNVEQALRVLKKKMQREGVFREMKARRSYEKPSEKRVREKAEAVRRARKAARKQAQREGLLPMPKKKLETAARPRTRA